MELYRPPCLLSPWTPQAAALNAEIAVIAAWEKLHVEDLYKIVFHENPNMPLAQFVQFFSQPNVALQLCLDLTDEVTPQLAGMVWLADITDLPSHRRATGSFCFFRGYQTPRWTSKFAEMTLRYWFECLRLGVLVGITPGPNRAARIYSKRAGIEYPFELPGYTSFDGKACTAHVGIMDRRRYEEVYGSKDAETVEV